MMQQGPLLARVAWPTLEQKKKQPGSRRAKHAHHQHVNYDIGNEKKSDVWLLGFEPRSPRPQRGILTTKLQPHFLFCFKKKYTNPNEYLLHAHFISFFDGIFSPFNEKEEINITESASTGYAMSISFVYKHLCHILFCPLLL